MSNRPFAASAVALCALVVLCAFDADARSAAPVSTPAPKIDVDRSLLITHKSVIEDPLRAGDPCTGASGMPLPVWSFGGLARQISYGRGLDLSSSSRNGCCFLQSSRESTIRSFRPATSAGCSTVGATLLGICPAPPFGSWRSSTASISVAALFFWARMAAKCVSSMAGWT
jgi:hypothetical protein